MTKRITRQKEKEFQKLLDDGCGRCRHDEASGLILNHCNDCCRKITVLVWDLRNQGKIAVGDFDAQIRKVVGIFEKAIEELNKVIG